MLKCRDVSELVTDYVEGRMSLGRRLQFQWHLGLCANCRAYLRQLEMTRQTLGKLPPIEVPKDVEAELRKRFSEWKAKPPTRSA